MAVGRGGGGGTNKMKIRLGIVEWKKRSVTLRSRTNAIPIVLSENFYSTRSARGDLF